MTRCPTAARLRRIMPTPPAMREEQKYAALKWERDEMERKAETRTLSPGEAQRMHEIDAALARMRK